MHIFQFLSKNGCMPSMKSCIATGILLIAVYACINIIGLGKRLKLGSRSEEKQLLFKVKLLVLWTLTTHTAVSVDLANLLTPLGGKVIIKDISNVCGHFEMCNTVKDVKVLPRNYVRIHDDLQYMKSFYQAYKNESEFMSADAFFCYDPSSYCDLYAPFNKIIIFIASLRYSKWQDDDVETWQKLNRKMEFIASDPKNVIGGNNMYDVEYLKYFTGIQGQYLPSFCNYTSTSYGQTRFGFIFLRKYDMVTQARFLDDFNTISKSIKSNVSLTLIRELYPGKYKWDDVAVQMGIVHIPYQVSTMSIFEHYRMNISLFFPSKKTLIDWHLRDLVVCHRGSKQYGAYMPVSQRSNGSIVKPFLKDTVVPDPDNDNSRESAEHWFQFSDFYLFPHISYFDSANHLAHILKTIQPWQLWEISNNMKTYNRRLKEDLLEKWKMNLLNIAKYSANHPY